MSPSGKAMKEQTEETVIGEILADNVIGTTVTLNKMLGIVPAIMLNQIMFFIKYHKHIMDGHRWTYNSLQNWHEVTGFSIMTIRRALNKLADLNLIIRTDEYNKLNYDHTMWYTINPEALGKMYKQFINTPSAPDAPSSHELAEQKRACEAFRTGAGNTL